jgi:hypothetical protein
LSLTLSAMAGRAEYSTLAVCASAGVPAANSTAVASASRRGQK